MQIQLSKEEFSLIEKALSVNNLSFRFCTKHNRYEKNYKNLYNFEKDKILIKSFLHSSDIDF